MRKIKVLAGLMAALLMASGVYAQQPAKPAQPAGNPGAVSTTMGAMPAMEKPAVPTTLNDASVVVVVGDISGTIDRVGNNVSGKFSPMFNGAFLKTMLGGQLQDPVLAGLNNGKSGLVGIFKSGPLFFVEVDPAQSANYKTAIAQAGTPVEVAEGMLVTGGPVPGMTEAATKLAGEAKAALAKEKHTPSIKATVNMPKVLATYNAEIKQGLAMMAAQSTPATGQQQVMMQINMGVALAAAKDVETASLELIPDEKGNLLGEVVVKAKAGSNLATFLAAKGGDTAGLLEMLPGKGAVRATVSINGDAYLKLVQQYADVAFKELGTAKADQDAYLAMMSSKQNLTGDAAAMEFLIPGQKGLTGFTVTHVADPTNAIATIEKSMEQVKENMKQAQFEVTFKKDARKYKDIGIHQLMLKQSGANMPAPLADVFGSIQADFAVVGNLVVSAMGGQSIDTLIDNVQAKKSATPTALVAPTKLGAGAKSYADINMGNLVKFGFDLAGPEVANSPIAGMPAALESVPPITAAMFNDATTATGKFLIPGDLFAKLGAELQKAKQGGGPGAPNGGAMRPAGAPMAAPAPAAPAPAVKK
ncbi:TPA: hypothetical protein DDW35_05525 [Candidatus Sumerlaeota bacterium]|jgi:hypothetical protein|nr:hypothetical protein [Candidatus Sumerlaeota bacterium]